ncbi:lysine-sensitive aspartokinase 3 [Rhodohalobacter sp.]|uniref:lysine-sensitive aspartokinase 3 n=1 Tax=Rhodohalobacter sp. TaxID=1974210 RepID=UPI002ACE37F5|nr:lysine-sensitive aspartokinase 3 [Rhodohalobacter sp.]MDZ7755327.1 lysine-sensitive aspartokinase 3 [Rhodohalobacter sp.]
MPDLIKVAKFGGTSMANYEAMSRCANIVKSDSDKKIIVVSATSGTTNLLTTLIGVKDSGEKIEIINQIREKHYEICGHLTFEEEAKARVDQLINDLEEKVTSSKAATLQYADEVLSFGELISSTIFSYVLRESIGDKVEWLDAREIIQTDHNHGSAEPEIETIEKNAETRIVPHLKDSCFVTQGFIGRTKSGVTTTLGRGGSDYSAALFAEAINADVLEIWTDVTAVYTTDPRIVKEAKPITEISFDEAAELSVFGAKVLHPATMVPAIRKNIRVYVGSSMEPHLPGTWIMKNTKEKPSIRAISLRRNQTLLTVHSLDMLHRHGFLARLFQVLSNHKISVDLVTTSEVSVSLTLDTNAGTPGKDFLPRNVISELKTFCEVEIQENLSLIALIGNNLHTTSGLSGPVFSSLEGINVRLICHGASSHNLCFLVDQQSAEEVVQKLHQRFI